MINGRKLYRKLVYPFVKKEYTYNDPVPAGHLSVDHVPDWVFERDVVLYNCGLHTQLNDYIVVVRPMFTQTGVVSNV